MRQPVFAFYANRKQRYELMDDPLAHTFDPILEPNPDKTATKFSNLFFFFLAILSLSIVYTLLWAVNLVVFPISFTALFDLDVLTLTPLERAFFVIYGKL